MTESSNIQRDLGVYQGCRGEFDLESPETTGLQDLNLFPPFRSFLPGFQGPNLTLWSSRSHFSFPFYLKLFNLNIVFKKFFSSLSIIKMTIFLSVYPCSCFYFRWKPALNPTQFLWESISKPDSQSSTQGSFNFYFLKRWDYNNSISSIEFFSFFPPIYFY